MLQLSSVPSSPGGPSDTCVEFEALSTVNLAHLYAL
jgi:hypothetical protein